MVVVSLFEHSLKLELAISELEQHKISKELILAKPVNKISHEKKYLDPYNAEGLNLFIVSMLGMICMLLGSIYGFVIFLGPVLCALIGLVIGATLGFIIDFIYKVFIREKKRRKNIADVLLLIKVEDEKLEMVEEILRRHHALGMVRI
jgi:ABC-type uncharacterized transport system permease subunit